MGVLALPLMGIRNVVLFLLGTPALCFAFSVSSGAHPDLCNPESSATETWFSQRIVWKYGKEGLAWKTTIKNPNDQKEYQLILQPLWAVEGGVVALEIVVTRPGQPDVNILGKRENGVEYPFVITVEELENGLAHSKFGPLRRLQAEDIALNIKIEHFRLGKGLGSGSMYCSNCKNLQELSVWITVKSKDE
jgi:hypothetical protein